MQYRTAAEIEKKELSTMKPAFCFFLFLFYHTSVNAQYTDGSFTNSTHFYTILSMDVGNVFSKANRGSMAVSFPYQTISATGTVTDDIFHSLTIKPFSKLTTAVSFVDVEAGTQKYFCTLRIAPYLTNDAAVSFLLGYGRNIYIGKHYDDVRKAALICKPSMHIVYSVYGNSIDNKNLGPNYLGAIDNEHKNIQLLGYTSDSVYQISSGGYRTPKVITNVNTTTLNIYYTQHNVQLMPAISFSNNPYQHRLHWQLDAGYYITLFERAGLVLLRDQVDRLNKHELINIRSDQITALFDGKSLSKNPYRIGGLYVGLKAGIVLEKRHKQEKVNKT